MSEALIVSADAIELLPGKVYEGWTLLSWEENDYPDDMPPEAAKALGTHTLIFQKGDRIVEISNNQKLAPVIVCTEGERIGICPGELIPFALNTATYTTS